MIVIELSHGLFKEWKELTRALFSAIIAMDREAALWRTLNINSLDRTEMIVVRSQRKYKVKISEHLRAVADEHALCSMALNLSYSLAEAFARQKLHVDQLAGGIEAWAEATLTSASRNWSSVWGGKQGLLEASVARNAIAHAAVIDQAVLNRFSGAGCVCPWQLGDAIRLDFETTQIYRDRLRSLLRVCSSKPKSNLPKPRKPRKPRIRAKRELRRARRQLVREKISK
jgi:hypothetical protein